jgi:hypothetical protein
MSGTLLCAEPAAEMSSTRGWYTVVWLERLSCLGARWGMSPAPDQIAAAGTAVALELVAGKVWALPKTAKASSRRCSAGMGPRCTR